MFPRMFDDQWAVEAQFAVLANSGRTSGLMVCPMAFWPSNPVTQVWMSIYQQAYDQVVQACNPSAFQRALHPSQN